MKTIRLLILVTLLMLAILLAGCASQNQSNPNTPSNQMMNGNNSNMPYGPSSTPSGQMMNQ